MAFVDEITIKLKAGDGGNGVERWRHEKYREFSGPSGGNGGRGGNVIAHGVHNLNALQRYTGVAELSAQNGQDGQNNSRQGASGDDLIFEVPRGSVLTNQKTGEIFRIDNIDEEVLILEGGAGGLGNEHFKSSRNTTPKETTPGESGEEAEFYIEVELFADFGLIGLPSSGKSSLLNALTGAKSKTAEYEFTTLEPHLGDMYGHMVADIPGLIRGASSGKGLGHKFLRHIRRTKVLLHCIPCDSADPQDAYMSIKEELEKFDPELIKKKEIIILTKRDEVDEEEYAHVYEQMKNYSDTIFTTSILDDESIKKLREGLIGYVEEE